MFIAVVAAHVGVAQGEGPSPDSKTAPVAAGSAAPASASASALSCPTGMIGVEGDYCADLPEQECLEWVSKQAEKEKKGRCLRFAPSKPCKGSTVHKSFCMDTYEYPNKVGENPVIMKNWYEARDTCKAEGKRLCAESEWTLACEGPQRLPYPYGLNRDAVACNIDKAAINVHEEEWEHAGPRRDAEVKRLWQGEASGARADCKSPHGVMDMTGNVDEWVVNETGKPHHSALKGGYWSWVRGRCRPVTDGHAEDFRYYQIGFRCCSDAPASTAAASK